MTQKTPYKILIRILKIILKTLAVAFAILLLVVGLLNIPAVQTVITGKISDYLKDDYNLDISVGAVKIAIPNTIRLEEIFVAGLDADTLLYAGTLKVDMKLFALLRNEINVAGLEIENFTGHVTRGTPGAEFNFQFILDAFASEDEAPAPDTTAPWKVVVGKIKLSGIKAIYHDETAGVDAALNLGSLNITIGEMDLDVPRMDIKKIELQNTSGQFTRWDVAGTAEPAPSADSLPAAAESLPDYSLGLLAINDVQMSYKDLSSKLDAELEIGNLKLKSESIDLPGKTVMLENLEMAQTKASLAVAAILEEPDSIANSRKTGSAPALSDLSGGWHVELGELALDDLSLEYDQQNEPEITRGIDYNHLHVTKLFVLAGDIIISAHEAGADLRQLRFSEQSGLQILKLAAQTSLTQTGAGLTNFHFETPESRLQGDFQARFSDFGEITENLGEVELAIVVQPSILNTGDLFFLSGINPADSTMRPFAGMEIGLDAELQGMVDDLQIKKLNIDLLENTRLVSHGSISGVTDTGLLSFDYFIDSLVTRRHDILSVFDTSVLGNITLPDSIFIATHASGSVDSIHAGLSFRSDYGALQARAFYLAPKGQSADSIFLNLQTENLHAGKFLAQESPGPVSLSTTVSATGLTLEAMVAHADGQIKSALYNQYNYTDISYEGRMNKGNFDLAITSGDPNINFDFEGSGHIDSIAVDLQSTLDLELLNLYELNFTEEKIALKTRFSLEGKISSPSHLKADMQFDQTELITENNKFLLEPVSLKPVFTPESTTLNFMSEIADLDFTANFPYTEMQDVLTAAANEYLGFGDSIAPQPGKEIDFQLNIRLPDQLRAEFIEELDAITLDTIHGSYRSLDNQFKLALNIPEIKYAAAGLYNLSFNVDGIHDSLVIKTGFDKLTFDTLSTGVFLMEEIIHGGLISSSISFANAKGQPDYLLKNDLAVTDTGFRVSFADKGLILNGQLWNSTPGNYLQISDTGWIAHEFLFTHNDQKIALQSTELSQEISIKNFEIYNLLNIFNIPPESAPFKGTLSAGLQLPVQNDFEGISAELSLNGFYFYQTLIGDLQFSLTENENNLDLLLSLVNPVNSLTAEGTIEKSEAPQKIDIEAKIDIIDPGWIEAFSMGEISQTEGEITGTIEIEGTTNDPQISGFVNFKNSRMKINQLNLMAGLQDETIKFDKEGIYFDNFTLTDAKSGRLKIDGSLLTTNYSDIAFDINLKANNFQAVNSTSKDNKMLYGTFILDADMDLKGNTELPRVDASITIQGGTDLKYVLPGSEIELVSSEGIIAFKNPDQKTDTLFSANDESYITDSLISKFSGIDLNTQIEIDPKARFTIVLDPLSGDYASISGSATLNFAMDPAGNQTLTGVYEVSQGTYQLSFYGLVKKAFEFQPGSSVSWSGDLMDASMNFTARHVVRTNSVALVSNESSAVTEAEKNMFRQRLPYEVLLHLNGFISEPEVGFNINLPEKHLVNYPAIASKLTMLNSPQNESELNKQVFALLVTGGFIADNPFASTGGSVESFATTAARNSVNGILADQLNKVSNKYIKGVEMNFGLTSYEDYSGSSSDVRTELDVQVSKKLLNDRLTIEATGSFDVEGERQYSGGSTSHTYGEFAATYDLTENGEYKIRAYRENAYDLFDGEVTFSGLAFIIEKSFNSLFKRKKKPLKPSENEEIKQSDH